MAESSGLELDEIEDDSAKKKTWDALKSPIPDPSDGPSMDEILASIRRVLSEDGPKDKPKDKPISRIKKKANVSNSLDDPMAAAWEASMVADDEEDGNTDDLAGEWAAMLDSGDSGRGSETNKSGTSETDGNKAREFTRVLNQDSIDDLLGVYEDEADGFNSGLKAVLNSSIGSYERMPMLEVVFDCMTQCLSKSLSKVLNENVEVSLDAITSTRYGDYLNSIPLPAIINNIQAVEWDGFAHVTVDSSFIYSVVDLSAGGQRGTAAMRIEGRPYTNIERDIIQHVISESVLPCLGKSFDHSINSPVTFRYDRLETNPRFATISRPSSGAVLARFRVDMEDRGGRIELLLPYATLEPVRELLLQMYRGAQFNRDAIWEQLTAENLGRSHVNLTARLAEHDFPLGELLDLKVGSVLQFNEVDPDVELYLDHKKIATGTSTEKKTKIAVQIKDIDKGFKND